MICNEENTKKSIEKLDKKWEKVSPKKDWKSPIEKAQERKAKHISDAQERKNDSIKAAGIQRDAVLIVTTFYQNLANDPDKEAKIAEKLLEWKIKIKDIFDQPF